MSPYVTASRREQETLLSTVFHAFVHVSSECRCGHFIDISDVRDRLPCTPSRATRCDNRSLKLFSVHGQLHIGR